MAVQPVFPFPLLISCLALTYCNTQSSKRIRTPHQTPVSHYLFHPTYFTCIKIPVSSLFNMKIRIFIRRIAHFTRFLAIQANKCTHLCALGSVKVCAVQRHVSRAAGMQTFMQENCNVYDKNRHKPKNTKKIYKNFSLVHMFHHRFPSALKIKICNWKHLKKEAHNFSLRIN